MPVLSDVSDLIMGQSPSSDTYNEEGDGLPFYQGKVDFGFRYPTPRIYCSAPKKIAEPGDILMSVRAPVGPTNICKSRSCIGRGLSAIRPRNINGLFLYYNIRYIEDRIAALGTGSTFKAINKAQLASVQINEKELSGEEQEKIAALLVCIEDAIEQQKRLIALTTELKKALMHKLFTEGTRGEPQKQTEIGPVPESWEVVHGKDAFKIKQGQVDPRQEPFRDMPHLGPENIDSGTGRTSMLQTNAELGISSGNYHFTEEDVVYSKIRPYLNKVFLPYGEGTCSADMYPLRPLSGVFSRRFLFQCLLSTTFLKQAMSFQDRTGIPKVNRGQLLSILLPKPSLHEQGEIAEHLATCDNKINFHVNVKRNLSDLFHTLLHQLMTAQVRVDNLDLYELSHESGVAVVEEHV